MKKEKEMTQWEVDDLQELRNRRQNLLKRLLKTTTLNAQSLIKKQIASIERELDNF